MLPRTNGGIWNSVLKSSANIIMESPILTKTCISFPPGPGERRISSAWKAFFRNSLYFAAPSTFKWTVIAWNPGGIGLTVFGIGTGYQLCHGSSARPGVKYRPLSCKISAYATARLAPHHGRRTARDDGLRPDPLRSKLGLDRQPPQSAVVHGREVRDLHPLGRVLGAGLRRRQREGRDRLCGVVLELVDQ